MPTAVPTVIFFSSHPVHARLAADVFNATTDPATVRALAGADVADADQAREATLQVTLGSRRAQAQPLAARNEQWPLLEPLGELGQPLDVTTDRVRQHVLDLVRREGWSAHARR